MSWDDAEKAFATTLPSYQPRVPQRNLAHFMERSLSASDIVGAFCQAPTGTGKSFPLLVALIDHAIDNFETTIAATATKALQDQYLRDLAFLKEHYRPELRYAVLKGRSNYVCKAKLAKEFDEAYHGIKVDDILRESENEDVLGDVDRLPLQISGSARGAMTMSSTECPGKSHCKFGEQCFAERAKKKASDAHVVVINHAMVATDAVLQAERGVSMLPNYVTLGVDEAHELAEYVAGALSTEVTERSLTNLVTDICQWLEEQHLITEGTIPATKLFQRLRGFFEGSNDRQVKLTPAMVTDLPEIIELLKFLCELSSKAAAKRASGDDEVIKKARLRNRLATTIDNLQSLVVADFADLVRWVELDEYVKGNVVRGRGIVLGMAPLKVAEFMANAIWSRAKPLLVSATLATDGDFAYMAHEVGLDLAGKYDTFDCESPFDYSKQAMTYIAGDIPNPRQSRSGHRAGVNVAISKLTEASQGRALHLFTSLEGMRDSYAACGPQIERMGYRVLKQGEMPTRQLAEAFKSDRHSVLFATKSFFTGVDVQGESLSLLTLDKLPFHVPTVVWQARCEALDATLAHLPKWDQFRKGSFMKMMLPDMIITLMQAYGRLIRSVSDTGLVAILDPAIAPGGPKYGTTVRNSLPPAPIVFQLAQALEFAKQIPVSPDLDLPTLTESADEGDLTEVGS